MITVRQDYRTNLQGRVKLANIGQLKDVVESKSQVQSNEAQARKHDRGKNMTEALD